MTEAQEIKARPQSLQCACGAIIAGVNPQSAMEAHQRDVHGQEPDAVAKRLEQVTQFSVQALALLLAAKDDLLDSSENSKSHKLGEKIAEFLQLPNPSEV